MSAVALLTLACALAAAWLSPLGPFAPAAQSARGALGWPWSVWLLVALIAAGGVALHGGGRARHSQSRGSARADSLPARSNTTTPASSRNA